MGVHVYHASQYSPAQLAKYIQDHQSKNTYAVCPIKESIPRPMPNFGVFPYQLASEDTEHHIGIYWNGKDGSSTGSIFLGDKALDNQYYNTSADNQLKAHMFYGDSYSVYAERIGVCGPDATYPEGCTWSNPTTSTAVPSAETSFVPSAFSLASPSARSNAAAEAASSQRKIPRSSTDVLTVVTLDTGTPYVQLPKVWPRRILICPPHNV